MAYIPTAFLINDLRVDEIIPDLRDAGFTVKDEITELLPDAVEENPAFAAYSDQFFDRWQEEGGFRAEMTVAVVEILLEDEEWMDIDVANAVIGSKFTVPGDVKEN